MNHALLISPVSSLPTIVNTQSHVYAELMQAGYQVERFGTKKELTALEEELMESFVSDLELNEIN